MIFLTEEDVRARCPHNGSTLTLSSGERLTPSAHEYATGMRITVICDGSAAPESSCRAGTTGTTAPTAAPASSGAAVGAPAGMTYLDPANRVAKTHPRIVLRGKLDSLLAAAVLAETQFDPKNRLPGMLKECLTDVTSWIMQVLAAEVGNSAPEIKGMGGMDMETLHAVSREPSRYIGMDHSMAEASLGGNIALINWLRALTRETEIEAIRTLAGEHPVCHALNRLSSALYVLMLLTMAAQKGQDPARFRGE